MNKVTVNFTRRFDSGLLKGLEVDGAINFTDDARAVIWVMDVRKNKNFKLINCLIKKGDKDETIIVY